MTIAEAKHKFVQLALSEVGYHEGPNNWNKYAAELDPLGITWGKKQNLAWCGEFVIWNSYRCFGVNKGLAMMCSGNPTSIPVCSEGARYFQQANRWHGEPELGDIVFFYRSGIIGHTGIVVRVEENVFFTVEGNASDAVTCNKYKIGDAQVAGFGRPRWELAAETAVSVSESDTAPAQTEAAPKLTYLIQLPEIKKGDMGTLVERVQTLLIARGYDCGGRKFFGREQPDADFGPATDYAVRDLQKANKIEVDGVVGRETMIALLTK